MGIGDWGLGIGDWGLGILFVKKLFLYYKFNLIKCKFDNL